MFDHDLDGLLDLSITSATQGGLGCQRPTLHLKGKAGFIDVTDDIQLSLTESTKLPMHRDMFGDARREILIGASTQSLRSYASASIPFQDNSDMIGLGAP